MSNCVKCGYCCSVSPCGYGEGIPCIYLTPPNKAGQQFCMRYEYIMKKEASVKYSMFHCGCSGTVGNDKRDAVIKYIQKR